MALLADPARHHGERVRVVGYLNLEFEGNALYLSRADYDAVVLSNSVWVHRPRWISDTAATRLSHRYTLLEGTFRAGPGGHMGAWPGSIEDVTRAEPSLSRSEYAANMPRMPWWREYRILFPLATGLIFVVAVTGAAYRLGRHLSR